MIYKVLWAGGLLAALGVLTYAFVVSLDDMSEPLILPLVFFASNAIVLWTGIRLGQSNGRKILYLCFVPCVILFGLPYAPIYGKHSGLAGGEHRHSFWHLNHVH